MTAPISLYVISCLVICGLVLWICRKPIMEAFFREDDDYDIDYASIEDDLPAEIRDIDFKRRG